MLDLAVLDERPALRRPSTARALTELVAQERARQDARLASLRRLRGAAATLVVEEERPAPRGLVEGLVARLWGRAGRAARGTPTEAELRGRYEQAQGRARRAVVFAESLAALEGELAGELARLGEVLVDLAHDEAAIEALHVRVRAAAGDVESALAASSGSSGSSEERRALEARLDAARARASALEAERDAVRTAEDRLLGLVEGERMLGARLAHLRHEVERAAQEATRRLDDVADALRALVTTQDTAHVVQELEQALERLAGSLDESARLAAQASDALAEGR